MRRGNGTPRGAAPRTPAKESDTPKGTRADVDVEYDLAAPEALGYESDPLTADEWSAICLAESRDVALTELAP